jgi:cilia- and flagella-associated protein 251
LLLFVSLLSIPVQTYFDAHQDGVISVAITSDSRYLATLSAQHPQVLAIWEWTSDNEDPLCKTELSEKFGVQTNIRFNLENNFQLMTNSPNQAIFYEWSVNNGFVYFAPLLNDQVNIKFEFN